MKPTLFRLITSASAVAGICWLAWHVNVSAHRRARSGQETVSEATKDPSPPAEARLVRLNQDSEVLPATTTIEAETDSEGGTEILERTVEAIPEANWRSTLEALRNSNTADASQFRQMLLR